MSIHAGKLAKNRLKMLGMLDKHEPTSSRSGAFDYGQGKMLVSPASLRPRTVDPAQRLIRWVQAALITLLGVKLPLDGVMSANLRAALLAFQKKAGLSPSGAVDSETLRLLQDMVGLPAPAGTETAPPPWAEAPRKAPEPPQKPKPKHDGEGGKRAPEAEAAADHPDSAQRLQVLVLERFLQREALQAVMAQAFERSWIRDELQRTGRSGDAALLAEVLAWWEQAQSPDRETPPHWMVEVANLARPKPAEAIEVARRAWREHGTGPTDRAGKKGGDPA